MTLDIATAEGQAIVRQLAAQSDVLVENFKVGGLDAYGLGYEQLSELCPKLIYCSVTGFGQTGPYAQRAGYDLMVQAMSGMMSITGHADGEPGGGPLRVGVAITDIFAGLYASVAILAALQARQVNGRGQHIDISLLDVGMAVLANQGVGYLNSGTVPRRQGNSHPSLAPYQDFPTADGTMLLAIGNDAQFARFCSAAGHPEWAADARFSTNTQRVAHRVELIEQMCQATRGRTTSEWVTLLESRAVPCGPINDIAQAFEDPHVMERGMVIQMHRPSTAEVHAVASIASPIRLRENPVSYRIAPPELGQHTDEILGSLGISATQHDEFRRRGIV
jgi:crotonobetainyl-CoA:carnitine CoA-transferase CaiB-like acyl-CoA transferase